MSKLEEQIEDAIKASRSVLEELYQGIDHYEVSFPDGSKREAATESKAEEVAAVWLANRLGLQDNKDWVPSRAALDRVGIRIKAFVVFG